MSAVQYLNGVIKQLKRNPVSSDQTLAFSQGYKDIFNQTSAQDIAAIITASGVITLSNVYTVGRDALQVWIGDPTAGLVLYDEPGVDYTELTNRTIQLNGTLTAALSAPTSVIVVRWNRFLPGVRDQNLADLANVTPDIENAVLDTGFLRASPITASNPLASLADITTGGFLVNTNRHLKSASTGPTSGGIGAQIDFSALAPPLAIPAGYRYALCSLLLDVNEAGSSSGNCAVTAYMGPYVAVPSTLTSSIHNYVTQVNWNLGVEANLQNSGFRVITLNDPPNVAGDLSLWFVEPVGTAADISYSVFLEGWIK